MAIERTFSMIKPDATERNLTGKICAMLEKKWFEDHCLEKNKNDS
jgi:nucleoside diphosphate kinase